MLYINEKQLTPEKLMILGDSFSNSINLLRVHRLSDFNMLKSVLISNLKLARDIAHSDAIDMINYQYCHAKADELLKKFKEVEDQYNGR